MNKKSPTISPQEIRFIKLGEGGEWESSCIRDNTIRLGYHSPHHQDCLTGKWEKVRKYWLKIRNGNEGSASRDIKQIRDFYELSENDIWITFYERKLYWCHASKEVIELEDKSRIRKVAGTWHSTDINGKQLRIENIDGRVTKVQGFRGTICSIEMQDYLIRKIKGQTTDEVENAKLSLIRLKSNVRDLIQGLWWHDFELLIDLVFSKAGWQRFSVLGKTEKDIDLDIYSPTTQKRAFVQIKSTTSLSELDSYVEKFQKHDQFDEMYFIYHTSTKNLTINNFPKNIQVWDINRVSDLVVNAGLVEWLINKRS